MFTDLVISYPYWFLLLAVAAGLGYAVMLYYKNSANKLSAFWTVVLFTLRFISIFLLSLLLLSPYVKTKKKYIEKPIVVMGMDNSRSMILGKDSVFNKRTFPGQWQQLMETLSEKYQVEPYLFGARVQQFIQPDYSDGLSDYSQFIKYIREAYNGMNLGAVILAGDGIYNAGVEPVFTASTFSVPFYTIALGDTNSVADAKITDVRYNSLVYKDNVFPIEVNISAEMLKGANAELVISAFGRKQYKKKIAVTNDHFNASYRFNIQAGETGKHRIEIRLNLREEELNKYNNLSNIFIDVFDNAQKILLLANSPHPDISAISQALKSVTNYETEIKYLKDGHKIKVQEYDLVILHQVPSIEQTSDYLISELVAKEIPVLYVLGRQSSLPRFNQAFKGVNVLTSIGKFEEARADINPLFTRFSYNPEFSAQLEELPPVIVPTGNYVLTDNASVFAYQKINNISTDFPLVVFYDNQNTKSGAFLGEGIWLWRMHNYVNQGNFDAFDSFINKTVQYLVAKKDKRFFRVTGKNEYRNTENIILQAELYNDSYEAVTTSEVSLKLTDEENRQFNYLFSPEGDIYSLDLKRLEVGVYRYLAQTQLGTEKYEASGEFIVSGQSFESKVLKADHRVLYGLAETGNGQMLYPDNMTKLPELLTKSNLLKKRIYFEEKLSGLNTMPWVIFLILFLLSLEWFLRKYFGSY